MEQPRKEKASEAEVTGPAGQPTQPSPEAELSIGKIKKMAPAEEAELAQRSTHGDVNAAARLYDHYFNSVYGFFYRRVGNIDDAEDLTAETFYRAIQGLYNGTWRGQPFGAWLFTTAKYVFFEWLRKEARESNSTLNESQIGEAAVEELANKEADIIDQLAAKDDESMLWRLVRKLSVARQRVIIMRYVYKLSYAEIARRMGRTESACKMLHTRALEDLRQKIQKAGLWNEFGPRKGE